MPTQKPPVALGSSPSPSIQSAIDRTNNAPMPTTDATSLLKNLATNQTVSIPKGK